jgi:alpha-L-fucosidase
MGPQRDILRELREAAEKRGITFCASSHRAEHYWFLNHGRDISSDVNDPAFNDFYGPAAPIPEYSDPIPEYTYCITAPAPTEAFLEDWLVRTCELIDLHRPGLVYFDWWIHNVAFKPYLKKFAAYYYNRAAEWGKEVTINYKFNAFAYTSGVMDIERGQLGNISPNLWQNDTAIVKNSWGYTENNDYKKTNDIICDLIDVVSKNGCLMLNVGPKADGTITEEETAVLLEIGEWLKVNGEGIYRTTFWKTFGEGPTEVPEGHFQDTRRNEFTSRDVRYTYKDGYVYAFVMKYPDDGDVRLAALKRDKKLYWDFTVQDVTLLGYPDSRLTYERTPEALFIKLEPCQIPTHHPICFKIGID